MGKKSDSRFWCKIKNYIAPIGFVVTLHMASETGQVCAN